MGYTHYWENHARTIPDGARAIIREIVDEAYASGIIQVDDDQKGLPIVTERLIRFNGIGELGHETFVFDVDHDHLSPGGHPFTFCKTNHKPYDTVVMEVSIVLKWALQELISIRSDGSFDEEWIEARDGMHKRYGIETYVHEELIAA